MRPPLIPLIIKQISKYDKLLGITYLLQTHNLLNYICYHLYTLYSFNVYTLTILNVYKTKRGDINPLTLEFNQLINHQKYYMNMNMSFTSCPSFFIPILLFSLLITSIIVLNYLIVPLYTELCLLCIQLATFVLMNIKIVGKIELSVTLR